MPFLARSLGSDAAPRGLHTRLTSQPSREARLAQEALRPQEVRAGLVALLVGPELAAPAEQEAQEAPWTQARTARSAVPWTRARTVRSAAPWTRAMTVSRIRPRATRLPTFAVRTAAARMAPAATVSRIARLAAMVTAAPMEEEAAMARTVVPMAGVAAEAPRTGGALPPGVSRGREGQRQGDIR